MIFGPHPPRFRRIRLYVIVDVLAAAGCILSGELGWLPLVYILAAVHGWYLGLGLLELHRFNVFRKEAERCLAESKEASRDFEQAWADGDDWRACLHLQHLARYTDECRYWMSLADDVDGTDAVRGGGAW